MKIKIGNMYRTTQLASLGLFSGHSLGSPADAGSLSRGEVFQLIEFMEPRIELVTNVDSKVLSYLKTNKLVFLVLAGTKLGWLRLYNPSANDLMSGHMGAPRSLWDQYVEEIPGFVQS